MAETVRVEYVLSDRISNKLKKIQAQALKTEAALAGIDKRLEKLSSPTKAKKFADNWQKSFTKVNKAATTHGKKIDGLTTSTEKWGKAANKTRQELRHTRDTLKSLDRHVTTATRGLEKQARVMKTHSDETAQAANHMFALGDAEKHTSKHMAGKNREAQKQRKILGGLNSDMKRMTFTARRGDKALTSMFKAFERARGQSYFAEAVSQGADLYFTFRKMLGVIPMLATGLGGIANVINSIGTGVVTLAASLGRLSGALGAVGGLYASLGIAAGVGKGTVDSLFKPMVKNAEKLRDVEKQIANNRRSAAARTANAGLSRAKASQRVRSAENKLSTGKATQSERDALASARLGMANTNSAAAANGAANLNALLEDQAKLMRETNPRFKEFNNSLENMKANYRAVFSGDANANIDFAMEAFKSLNTIMGQLVPQVKAVQGSIRGFIGKGLAMLMKPSNMKTVKQAFGESAKSVNILGNIMEKVAPLFLKIVVASQKYANRVLSTIDAWLKVKESTGEIAGFAEKVEDYFKRSEKSLYRWTSILKNLGGAFANIFKAAAPTTEKFETNLESVTKNFKTWTGNAGNFKKMEVFFAQTYRTLQAVGRVAISIASMFGQASGGGDPAKSRAIADSMVEFLDTLGSGLQKFGAAAGNSLTTVGPALTEFFKALGPLLAALDVSPAVEALLKFHTVLLKFFSVFVEGTGSGGVLNAIANFSVVLTGLGLTVGHLISPLGKATQFFSTIGRALGGAGKAGGFGNILGGMGGKVGKAAGTLQSATALPVFVTNWAQIAGASTVGDFVPGGAGGMGKKGGKMPRGFGEYGAKGSRMSRFGAGAAKWGGRAGIVGATALLGYDAYQIAKDKKLDANGKATRALGMGAGAAGGAAAGAAIGSIIPGVGTGIGAGIGAVYGAHKASKGGADGLFADPMAVAQQKRYEAEMKRRDKIGQVLGQAKSGIIGIEQAQEGIVKANTSTLDLNKQNNRIAFLAATNAVGMTEAQGRELLERQRQLQQTAREARLLAKIRANKITNKKVADDLAKKMGVAAPGAGGAAINQAKAGVQVDNMGKKVKVVKTEAEAAAARQGIAAAGRYGQNTGIDRVMTQQQWSAQQTLGGAGVMGQLTAIGDTLKPALETLKKTQQEAVDNVVDIYTQGNTTTGKSLKEYENTIKVQQEAIAEAIRVTGLDISGNTAGWVTDTNAALGGLKNPVASPSGGAGSPMQPATQGLATGGFVGRFARGGVIGGDPRRGDVVPIMAAGGEVVLNEEQQQKVGKGRISSALMSSTSKHHKSFGPNGRAQQFADGGTVENPFKKIESMFGLKRSSGDHDGAGVHTSGSYHYRPAPWGGVQAYDYGDAINSQSALAGAGNYALSNSGLFAESFFDKLPSYVKNGSVVKGAIGGHSDHLHQAISASGAFPGSNSSVAPSGIKIPPVPNFGKTRMGVNAQATVGAAAKNLQALVGMGANPASLDASGVKGYAQQMLAQYGWGPDQFAPLDSLWTKESNWNPTADNPTSDAYGIPQALPGSKMASAGPDWQTNPATQIKWGLGYIKGRYGNPAQAWAHSQANNWYGNGGSFLANGPQTIGVGENGPERVSIKPLSAGGTRNRNGSSTGGGGNTFNTNISVGVLVGNEAALKQLTEMVGDRFAEDVRKAQATVVNGD